MDISLKIAGITYLNVHLRLLFKYKAICANCLQFKACLQKYFVVFKNNITLRKEEKEINCLLFYRVRLFRLFCKAHCNISIKLIRSIIIQPLWRLELPFNH